MAKGKKNQVDNGNENDEGKRYTGMSVKDLKRELGYLTTTFGLPPLDVESLNQKGDYIDELVRRRKLVEDKFKQLETGAVVSREDREKLSDYPTLVSERDQARADFGKAYAEKASAVKATEDAKAHYKGEIEKLITDHTKALEAKDAEKTAVEAARDNAKRELGSYTALGKPAEITARVQGLERELSAKDQEKAQAITAVEQTRSAAEGERDAQKTRADTAETAKDTAQRQLSSYTAEGTIEDFKTAKADRNAQRTRADTAVNEKDQAIADLGKANAELASYKALGTPTGITTNKQNSQTEIERLIAEVGAKDKALGVLDTTYRTDKENLVQAHKTALGAKDAERDTAVKAKSEEKDIEYKGKLASKDKEKAEAVKAAEDAMDTHYKGEIEKLVKGAKAELPKTEAKPESKPTDKPPEGGGWFWRK